MASALRFMATCPRANLNAASALSPSKKSRANIGRRRFSLRHLTATSALFTALLATARPKTRLCLATDLTLADESIATHRLIDWQKRPPPPIDKRPTVFLLLAD